MNRISFIIAFVFISCLLNAQVESPLWRGNVPNAISNDTIKETTTHDGITRVANVKKPTLTFYLPPTSIATGAAVIICPGGGYSILAIDHEGYKIAEELNKFGIAAIILKYRLPDDRLMENKEIVPLMDAQQAIRYIRSKASMWNINPNKIGIMGFSAGGHLAATASTHFTEVVGGIKDKTSVRPDFSILIYPVISFKEFGHAWTKKQLLGDNPTPKQIDWYSNELWVTDKTPPAFLVHSTNDGAVPVKNSLSYYEACVAHNVPVAMHIFQTGEHGYGLMNEKGPESEWMPLLHDWLKQQHLID